MLFRPIRELSCLLTLFGTAVGASAAFSQEPVAVVLTPDSRWVANWAEDRCRLMRRFVDKDGEETILYLEQIAPGSAFNMLVAGDKFDLAGRGEKISVAFGSFPRIERGFTTGRFGEYSDSALFSNVRPNIDILQSNVVVLQAGGAASSESIAPYGVPEASNVAAALDPAVGSRIDSISLLGENGHIRLQTGSLADVFSALNACSADLLDSMGITMEEYAAVAVQPVPTNMATVARKVQRQYPLSALRQGRGTSFAIKLIIGEDGRVETCNMAAATDDEGFTDIACRILLREAEFEPGQDIAGRPVRSTFSTTIRYQVSR